MKTRAFLVVLSILAPTLTAAHAQDASQLSPPETAAGHRLDVLVITRNDQGKVFCGLWSGAPGYPTERGAAVGNALDRHIQGGRAHCVFDDLEPGREYAVAAFHDENGNNDLDTGLFGIPSEGTGASNDARGFMGPPSYPDARFVMPDAPLHRMTIHIGY